MTSKSLLASAFLAGFAVLAQPAATVNAQEKPAQAAEMNLGQQLVGTWVLAGAPGEGEQVQGAGARLLHLTGKHWVITQADPKTGVTVFHHGGTYTLDGNECAETVVYANENTAELIKQKFKFTMKVEGDTLTKAGIGNPWSEVWKRVK